MVTSSGFSCCKTADWPLMGLILLSIFSSVIAGCLVWLVIGDRFPPGEETKLSPLHNIVIYSLIVVVPIYLFIFFVIG